MPRSMRLPPPAPKPAEALPGFDFAPGLTLTFFSFFRPSTCEVAPGELIFVVKLFGSPTERSQKTHCVYSGNVGVVGTIIVVVMFGGGKIVFVNVGFFSQNRVCVPYLPVPGCPTRETRDEALWIFLLGVIITFFRDRPSTFL